MRDIKFRAWHEESKMMHEVKGIDFVHHGGLVDMPMFGYAPLKKVILVQYTGLKDKNGKDIYEGDILDVDGTPWLVEPIGTEERDGGKFGLCASPYGSGEAYFIDKSILDGKVIGNIYENAELLKGDENE
jgi:phage uncharacterized protein TIGR01671